jgi:hypothetical protein
VGAAGLWMGCLVGRSRRYGPDLGAAGPACPMRATKLGRVPTGMIWVLRPTLPEVMLMGASDLPGLSVAGACVGGGLQT